MPTDSSNVSYWLLLGLLALVALLLYALLRRMTRPRTPLITAELRAAIQQFGIAAQHHVDVNAVLAMTKQFSNNPRLIDELSGYSRQAVGAALLYRVSSLGGQLKTIQDQMNHISVDAAKYDSYKQQYDKLKVMATNLQNELTAADKAVQSFRAGLQSV